MEWSYLDGDINPHVNTKTNTSSYDQPRVWIVWLVIVWLLVNFNWQLFRMHFTKEVSPVRVCLCWRFLHFLQHYILQVHFLQQCAPQMDPQFCRMAEVVKAWRPQLLLFWDEQGNERKRTRLTTWFRWFLRQSETDEPGGLSRLGLLINSLQNSFNGSKNLASFALQNCCEHLRVECLRHWAHVTRPIQFSW